MQDITIGRFKDDPEAQGVIRPQDGRWQLVLDKDGYPHLYVQCNIKGPDGELTKGLLNVEDMLIEQLTIRDLMDGGEFGGELSPEEEEQAYAEMIERKEKHGIPCPRP